MVLKNYTTGISVDKTILEIEKLLAKNGASGILKTYDSDGEVDSLMFKIEIDGNSYPFKLPMQRIKIQEIFRQQIEKGKLAKRYYNDTQQASRTGWRIIKDWIDSQLALIQIDLVKFEEVFLPYMYNEREDKTFFNMIEEKGFHKMLENHK